MSSNRNFDEDSSENEEENDEYSTDSREEEWQTLNEQINAYILRVTQETYDKLKIQERELKTQCEQLTANLEENESTLEHLENEKESLMSLLSDDSFETGDFFNRMKAYEYQEAELNGELKGLTLAIKNLTEQIKIQTTVNQTLQKKLDFQLSKLPEGVLIQDSQENENAANAEILQQKMRQRRFDGSQESKKLRNELRTLEEECYKVKCDCEDLRESIRIKSVRLQTHPHGSLDDILEQKKEIQNEIDLKQKQLKQLLLDEKKLSLTQKKKAEKEKAKIEKMESNEQWESERNQLLSSISQKQQELQYLCDQFNIEPSDITDEFNFVPPSQFAMACSIHGPRINRNSSSLSESRKTAIKKVRDDESDARSKISQKSCFATEKAKYTHEALRMALNTEMEALKQPNHPINASIRIETNYAEDLRKELEHLQNSSKQIEEFEQETFNNLAESNVDILMWKQRLDVLRNEFQELRTSKV